MKTNFEDVYTQIGYLFYALASESRKLSPDEYDDLRKLIGLHWQTSGNRDADLQLHLAGCMYNSVWVGFHNHMEPHRAFELFENFYFVHKLNFGISLCDKIIGTSKAIAHDFSFFSNGHTSELVKITERLLLDENILEPA